jgi:hypothetical protein
MVCYRSQKERPKSDFEERHYGMCKYRLSEKLALKALYHPARRAGLSTNEVQHLSKACSAGG